MSVMKSGALVLCLTLVVGVTSATSSEVTAVQYQRFATWDTDGDGLLSPAEAQEVDGLPDAFQKADASQDGKVDPQEYVEFERINEEQWTVGRNGGRLWPRFVQGGPRPATRAAVSTTSVAVGSVGTAGVHLPVNGRTQAQHRICNGGGVQLQQRRLISCSAGSPSVVSSGSGRSGEDHLG
jgi:hypothetical protein